MPVVALPKSQYSEHVVRKALYWLTEHSGWMLADDAISWIVTLDSNSSDHSVALYRLLNDFRLREDLDRTTKGLRAKIIAAALNRLANA